MTKVSSFQDAQRTIENFKISCSTLRTIILNFSIVLFDWPKIVQQTFLQKLAFFRVPSKDFLNVVDFINNFHSRSTVHQINKNTLRILRPVIDRVPVYRYNRLQTDLYRYIGRQRMYLLRGRSAQYKLLRKFGSLSFLPDELKDLLMIIDRKKIPASTDGFNSPIMMEYFLRNCSDEYAAEDIYLPLHQQTVMMFYELRILRNSITYLPTYSALSPFDRHLITFRTGLSPKILNSNFQRHVFDVAEMQQLVNAITFEIEGRVPHYANPI